VLEVGVFKGGNVKADQPKLIASHLLAVLESEIPATTAVFSALPPRRLDYRPDQTSKSALALMRHIVLEDEWFLRAIADGKFSPPPDDSDACGLLTPAQAVEYYNATLPAAIARVRQLSDEDLDKTLEPDGRLSAPGDPLPVADGPALGAPPRTVERLHPIDGAARCRRSTVRAPIPRSQRPRQCRRERIRVHVRLPDSDRAHRIRQAYFFAEPGAVHEPFEQVRPSLQARVPSHGAPAGRVPGKAHDSLTATKSDG
jgi:hypothetical protein